MKLISLVTYIAIPIFVHGLFTEERMENLNQEVNELKKIVDQMTEQYENESTGNSEENWGRPENGCRNPPSGYKVDKVDRCRQDKLAINLNPRVSIPPRQMTPFRTKRIFKWDCDGTTEIGRLWNDWNKWDFIYNFYAYWEPEEWGRICWYVKESEGGV